MAGLRRATQRCREQCNPCAHAVTDPARALPSDSSMDSLSAHATRRFAIGAELLSAESASFRVWAPQRRRVSLVIEDQQREMPLLREPDGYFSATVTDVG